MNIAVDIDDTLTNSFDYFRPFVAEYFHVTMEELIKRNISYNNLPPEWEVHKVEFYRHYFDDVVADTPFKEDALWGVQQLRDMGHKIVIITARNTEYYTDPYKTTREELSKAGIEYDTLICTLDKVSACEREGIDLLIDDSIKHCDAVSSKGMNVLLFTSKKNEAEQTSHKRVSNWSEVIEIVSSICISQRV